MQLAKPNPVANATGRNKMMKGTNRKALARKLVFLYFPLIAVLASFSWVSYAIAKDSSAIPCHIILASKQCVNLVGKWRVEQSKGSSADKLEIRTIDNRSKFYFAVEVTRGGSLTHIENSFELKSDIGLYFGAPISSSEKPCVMVFAAVSPRMLKVISFGTCEEGHGAYPDGLYVKARN